MKVTIAKLNFANNFFFISAVMKKSRNFSIPLFTYGEGIFHNL